MRLTIGRKLGLLIGVLMSLFIITGLISYILIDVIDGKITEITETEEPASSAVYEMEISTIGTGMGVLKYMDTADQEYRKRVEKGESDFKKFFAKYLRLAETPKGKELGNRVSALYNEFWALGEAMMAKKAFQEELFDVVAYNFEKIDVIIKERLQARVNLRMPDKPEKMLALSHMETFIAEVGSWLGNYLRTQKDEYKERIFKNAGDILEDFTKFEKLRLTEEERHWTTELKSILNETISYIEDILYINVFLQKNILKFIDLGARVEDILENEIQALTHTNLTKAKEDAHRTANRAIAILIVAVPVALFIGILVAWVTMRSVTRPVAKLVSATNAIAKGDFYQKVDISSKDEIGVLGGHFNNMAEDLKQYFAERMQAQEALRNAHDELEQRVEDRTDELVVANKQLMLEIEERKRAQEERAKLEDRLQRAQKMEALGTLAGGVAHDLNNVLSGIVGYPDLLLMQLPEDSPLRESILAIKNSGEKAANIVEDLLTLARRGVTNTEVLNLNDIILKYLKSPELQKLRSYHPRVKVETDLDEGLLNISGSPVHLDKTVMNLVSNAAEAMPHGGKVFISTKNQYMDSAMGEYDQVKEGDYVTLIVSDSGIGIPLEDKNRIFEPFYTKKAMGRSGTGLGMAVVWGTVKDHMGYIDVQSAEGRGTAFTLYFPVTREEISQEKARLRIKEYMGKGESILVIDDVRAQREIALTMLTTLGYAADAVSSGEEALEYLKKRSADLIVLDMIMDPGMDGLDTYKKILELEPGQKAVIASGFSESERVEKAQRLGVGKYIKKPYTLEKIGLAVKAELEK